MKEIRSTPFAGQRPGTSGLRKQTQVFMQPHFLENFVQSVFDVVREETPSGFQKETLVIGGDGRFFNPRAIQTLVRIAAANGFGSVLIGRHGLLSTPAMSAVIRKRKALGGLILSASHNPGGLDGDFGIKYNMRNGGPATERTTEKIYARSQSIDRYYLADTPDFDLSECAEYDVESTRVSIISPLDDYLEVLKTIFDFDCLRSLLSGDFRMAFDAMNAVTGPYAYALFESLCGAPAGTVMRGKPLEDFGGIHPDPNLIFAKTLVDRMYGEGAPDFGAASDGDGDRNLILGRKCFVSPGDSLAVISRHAEACIPGYKNGLLGIARSMPTSTAADRVAKKLGVPLFETPTGWKFFGSLMDADMCTLCGEESFGTGSSHVREKDGLWAVLAWLSIIAVTGKSVRQLLSDHWREFGRSYFQRHDFEGLKSDNAQAMIQALREQLPRLAGTPFAGRSIRGADDFYYEDPVTKEISANQGIRLFLDGGSRVVCRLSGTGTQGATLRVYAERYETQNLESPTESMLQPMVDALVELIELKKFCAVEQPSLVT